MEAETSEGGPSGTGVASGISPYILEIKTVQSTTFKQVIDALKEILMDVNLEFDAAGMKVVATDNTQTVLVHLKLDAEPFETFYCEKKLYVGINILKLHMLIKTITNNDILTLFVEREDPNNLGIRIENAEKKMRTTYKLSMLDINVVNITIPPAEFQTIITMPSLDFQKIVRDMHNLADFMEIRCFEDCLSFSCKGDSASQTTLINTHENGGGNLSIVRHAERKHEIVQGVFSLKYLSSFTKCSGLSNNMEIYIRSDYPLVIVHRVAALGQIKLALASHDTQTS